MQNTTCTGMGSLRDSIQKGPHTRTKISYEGAAHQAPPRQAPTSREQTSRMHIMLKYMWNIMVLKTNISISQFLFALENILVEKRIVNSLREVDWETVEYYIQSVLTDYPDFKLDSQQLKSFKRKYLLNKRRHSNRREPMYLDKLTHLLRQARDGLGGGVTESASTTESGLVQSGLRQPSVTEQPSMQATLGVEKVCELLYKLVSEVADLKVEFRDLKQQVLANLPSRGEYGLRQPRVDGVFQTPSIEQAPVVAEHTSPASKAVKAGAKQQAESTTEYARSLYNQVLQSVGSQRPFVRARQRVALCILYISGFTIANLQRLTVGHLKQLRQFAHGGCDTAPFPLRLQPSVSIELVASILVELDIIISDVSNETPAFRTHPIKARHCPRESLTKELNQILGSFQLSTQSWRAMP